MSGSSGARVSGLSALAALAACMACGRAPAGPAPSRENAAQDAPDAPPAVESPDAADARAAPGAPRASSDGAPWPTLVRDEQWDAAWRALDALPEAERSRPELRYVRARVALARGDAQSVLPLLSDLEPALPLLADDVARRRAAAELEVGPFAEAGEWYAARTGAASQLDAARAFEKAKETRRARAAADRVIATDKRTRAQEGEARSIRGRLADEPVSLAQEDARWLAVQGAGLPGAADALALVARVDPSHPLTSQELMQRAHVLSDAGSADEAIHAIELASVAPGSEKVKNRDRARAMGMTLYRARGRWSEAAKVLGECAGAGGPDAPEDAFLAARALSRADRDDEAIRAYKDVERRYPKSTWGARAAFFGPYLRMLHGQWGECARGLEAYARVHSGGEDARDARRDGALCLLLNGEAKSARAVFERLVDEESDPTASARMANMAALAALRDGDRTHAIARWSDVVRTRPLSWPSLIARARLAEAGVALPPAIEPPPGDSAGSPLAVDVPAPAGLLHELGLDGDAEAAVRDRESAVTSGAGGRASEALCAVYGKLGRARRRFQIAQSLPASLFAAAPGPRTRWAWECAFPSPYEDAVRAAEARERLPPGLLWAVMRQESAFDPDAVSPARAVGLMQMMADTARSMADELELPRDDARLTSPSYSIRVSARFLRKLLDRFGGVVPLAVAAYNGGADSVERWTSRAPGLDLDTFVERIPFQETRDYVVRVMGNLARYAYLAQGDAGIPRVELALGSR